MNTEYPKIERTDSYRRNTQFELDLELPKSDKYLYSGKARQLDLIRPINPSQLEMEALFEEN